MKHDTIDWYLLKCNPGKYLSVYIKTIDDIFNNYSVISEIECPINDSNRIITLLCEYILENKRNKKALARKILYKVIKNSSEITTNQEVIDLLFNVYKLYIFKNTEDSWRLSIYLKDVILSDDQISWLVLHCMNNELILNRVLRYPVRNSFLQSWAEEQIQKKVIIEKRFSEQLALAITNENYDIYINDRTIKTSTLAWAVYYSKTDCKKDKLLRLVDREKKCLDIAEVALRLDFPEIIEYQKEKML